MQPMIQRVRHCVLCGGDIASGGRIDRRYCSGSCRTLAYRARLQQHAKEPESIAPPPWSVVRLPPFSSALAALGELQSRIALLTTQLSEQEREHRKELHVGQNSTFAQQPTRREAEAQEAATAAADSRTPTPKLAAKAIAAKPSMTDLTASWSIPWPRPSDRAPRIARGPTQKSKVAVSQPSMKRSRAA